MIRPLSLAAVILVVGALVASSQQSPAVSDPAPTSRQYSPPWYVFSADLPRDLVTHDTGAIGTQPFVDIMAWDAFLALNWPAPQPIAQRGVPDRQNVTGGFFTRGEGGSSSLPNGPTVWETFKDTADIYLNPPVKPTSFDTPESIPGPCQNLTLQNSRSRHRTLTTDAKASDVLTDFKQAFTMFPLIDQNGQKVWYEVKVNRAYYDYVVGNGFYDSRNQAGKQISFPPSSNTTRNEPVVKVKAAWKIMGLLGSRQPDDPRRFYTTTALILDPATGKCSENLVGLVGLHIVMKTAQLPQWMWATFEHADNAPDQSSGPVPGKKYNFFSASCAGCPLNAPPSDRNPNFPTQVVRVTPVSPDAPNALYQNALRSLRPDNVWQNYMLVDAQWGQNPKPGVPNQPSYLANTTLETYLQGAVDDPKKPHGCINCHGVYAQQKDLDFQLFKAYPKSASQAAR
jgi:hypothetical protein